jgi:predicted nuclease with TOPRIM domain
MQLENIVQKHAGDIENLRNSIYSIGTDLQLLMKDQKIISEKMHEIGNDVRQLVHLTHEVKQSRIEIEAINKEIDNIKANYGRFEERFKRIDILSERNNSNWDKLINRWLPIGALILSLITALRVIYFK